MPSLAEEESKSHILEEKKLMKKKYIGKFEIMIISLKKVVLQVLYEV